MKRVNTAAISICLLGALPMALHAQSSQNTNTSQNMSATQQSHSSQRSQSSQFGPREGDREFSISGTGSSDQNIDSGSFGLTGELGWYLNDQMVAGIRQSINYASIKGESIDDDFWNGSTRGYINHQFLDERARPFIGASLGGVYGDGINDGGFAGLETGLKYYVQAKTYFLARVEYQFFFDSASDATDAFQDDGAWAYTVGLGYNF